MTGVPACAILALLAVATIGSGGLMTSGATAAVSSQKDPAGEEPGPFPGKPPPSERLNGYSFDTNSIEIIEGDSTFKIPRNFLFAWNPHLKLSDAVGLHIIFPEFSPITPQNASCFLRACDQIIWIAIANGNFPERPLIDKNSFNQQSENTKIGPFGLTEFTGYPNINEFKRYEAKLDDGTIFDLGCNTGVDPRLNMCHHREMIGNNSYFQYDFNIKYIFNWMDIQRNIRALIEKFREK